jgi:Glycosyl transferase family group 2
VHRPEVSVVMPFAGDRAAAGGAIEVLLQLELRRGDELILADNAGVAESIRGVHVVPAVGERSPAYARNVGAQRAHCEWILFLDADCRVPPGLLDAFFEEPVGPRVGALAGEVAPAPGDRTLAARYGSARSFLSQRAHLSHPYRPRAVAANLMVRRAAFEQLGGFYEGVRAAEDTDFSWRLQQVGWRLELRPGAAVEHSYRSSVRQLRRQWRGYAAGRAWLSRRYEGFEPEPALRRALARGWRRSRGGRSALRRSTPTRRYGPLERTRQLALDALLAGEELTGLALSNRPQRESAQASAQVVLVAERFPARGDPLVEFARTLDRARVEAVARPDAVLLDVARELEIEYREDEGAAARAIALVKLAARHPVRCATDAGRRNNGPSLASLAPAAVRLERDRSARLQALGGEEVHATARRLAALTGRRLDERDRS